MAISLEKRSINTAKYIRTGKKTNYVKIAEKFLFLMSALLFVMYMSITGQHDVEIQKRGLITPAFSDTSALK